MLELNLLDVVVCIILLFFLVRGLLRGFVREIGSLAGIIGGFALARHFQPSLQPTLQSLITDDAIAGVAAFVLIFILALIITSLAVTAVRKLMSITLTLWIDHFLGALGGLAKGLLVLTLAFYLAQGFFADLPLVQSAQTAPVFQSLTDYLRAFLPDISSFYRFPGRL